MVPIAGAGNEEVFACRRHYGWLGGCRDGGEFQIQPDFGTGPAGAAVAALIAIWADADCGRLRMSSVVTLTLVSHVAGAAQREVVRCRTGTVMNCAAGT